MTAIRDATAQDLPWLREVQRAAFAPFVEAIGREPAPMVEELANHLAQLRVVPQQGYLHRKIDGNAWWLETVAIAPDAQGHGIAGRLITDFEATARAAGATQLRLYTNIKMTQNLTLYPHLGYVSEGPKHVDGFDRIYFSKSLR